MKTEPTDLDREAATLFTPSPRARAWFSDPDGGAHACTVLEPETTEREWDPGNQRAWVAWEGRNGACSWVRVAWLVALDTDDPATVGIMLSQVEAADPTGLPVEIYRLTLGWLGTNCPGEGGPTRGAALVAAKRALKAKP